jgi:hypothetical protein
MANEVVIGYKTGATVTADVAKPDGTEREFDVSCAETARGKVYLGDCATIEVGDLINAFDNGDYIGSEKYDNRTAYKLASDGLDSVATTEPDGVASNFREMMVQVWRRFFKKSTATLAALKTYKDDASTNTTQTVGFDGTTKTVGDAS